MHLANVLLQKQVIVDHRSNSITITQATKLSQLIIHCSSVPKLRLWFDGQEHSLPTLYLRHIRRAPLE